jgi:hypothetical protein
MKMDVAHTALALVLLDEDEIQNQKEEREYWVRPWLDNRKQFGTYHSLFQELKKDEKAFKEFIRMDESQFEFLVERLTQKIIKEDTTMRQCIKPHEMVCLTLRYLASGESFRSLEFQFRIGRKTVSKIVYDVCRAIFETLGPDHLNTPRSKEKWLEISQKFEERWNFPNGLGAIDGKHIVMEQPFNSGSHYRNYKGTDSIILMAMVGPEYEFLYVDVGINGRNSDGGIWSRCPLKDALERNILDIPDPTVLPGRLNKVPYVCTGDDAFPLSTYMMKPFPQSNLTKEKRVFNYRLSRMRRISENGFGILANRWRIFRRPFSLEPEKVKIITLAAITLHNWLRSVSDIGKTYIPSGLIDRENIENGEVYDGAWRADTTYTRLVVFSFKFSSWQPFK